MRQLTRALCDEAVACFSKLPMWQLTGTLPKITRYIISKLPMRQLTPEASAARAVTYF